MNISKEHIEELIFEYHEGNLSDGEKSELMNIIHQYPEFEADFALWAQTYAHVEDSLPDYGLAANLIQKAPLAWYAHAWVKAGLVSGLVISSLTSYWLLRDKTEPKQRTPIVQQIEVKNEPKELVKSTTKPIIKMNYNSYNNLDVKPKIEKEVIVDQTSKVLKTLEVSEVSELTEGANQTVEISEERLEVLVARPDTVQKTIITEPKKAFEEKPQKKAKRKLPLNLKPAADFMPVNPNF